MKSVVSSSQTFDRRTQHCKMLFKIIILSLTLDAIYGVNLCVPVDVDNGDSILVRDDVAGVLYLHYSCTYGYTLSVSDDNFCVKQEGNSLWSFFFPTWDWAQPHPTCDPITCPLTELAIPDNGVFSLSGDPVLVVGKVATFTCDSGFRLDGPSERLCMPDGTWSQVNPVCVPVTCPLLEAPANGHLVSTRKPPYTVGVTLSVDWCSTGYNMASTVMICADGSTALRLKDGSSDGWCADGGAAREEEVGPVTCGEDGRWSGRLPTCELTGCEDPVVSPPMQLLISDGDRTGVPGAEVAIGAEVTFSCERGYRLVGDSIAVCGPDAQWQGEFPVCRVVSCGPMSPADPVVILAYKDSDQQYKPVYGDIVLFFCPSAFRLDGPESAQCLETGQWSEQPTCVALTCPPPSPIEHGTFAVTAAGGGPSQEARVGAVLTYRCDAGYSLKGANASLKCVVGSVVGSGDSGVMWSGEIPHCEVRQCSAPSVESDSGELTFVVANGFAYFSCATDYSALQGSAFAECVQDESGERYWQPSNPAGNPHCVDAAAGVVDVRCMAVPPTGTAVATLYRRGTCYQFIGLEDDRDGAAARCQAGGGQLVKIDDVETNDWLLGSTTDIGWTNNGVWIGLKYADGEWTWSDGEPVTYGPWYNCPWYNPRCGTVGDCATLRRDYGGEWDSAPCASALYVYSFICQYSVSQ